MYVLNLIYRNSSVMANFYFKAYKNYDEVRKKALALMVPPTLQEQSLAIEPSDLLEFEDDYGSMASIRMSDIASVIGGDAQKDAECKAEVAVIGQAEMGKAVQRFKGAGSGIVKPAGPIANLNPTGGHA